MTRKIPCTIMRGGTSKAVFLREADLPRSADERDAVILSIFGSPDRRQIDGLGGADPLTSKLAIIGPPPADLAAAGSHLSYTFGQVEIDRPEIDWLSLCGNISSAVGLYAVQEGLVAATQPITRVEAFNTNLGRKLAIEVPTENGEAVEAGNYTVPGVPGSGARIFVDFRDTAGGATGQLLPTGNPTDRIDVPGFGELEVSLVDIGNAHVFVRAADLGMTGIETAAEIDADKPLLALLETIRGLAAERMGMIADAASSREASPATPIIGMVSAPADAPNGLVGGTIPGDAVDVVSRLLFMQQTHKTYAGTSTVCTGIAARIPGTIVHELARPETRDALEVRIGHPAGVIVTESEVSLDGNTYRVHRATLGRTARRILDGTVFVRAPAQVA